MVDVTAAVGEAPRVNPGELKRLFRPDTNARGQLVAIVGFDGSGKTTQVENVAAALRADGREVIETRQPTDWYRQLSEVQTFHDRGGSAETAYILALLAAADRRRHVQEVIEPALARGAVVLCDRYVYATFAVFVHRGVAYDFLVTINSGIPRPDHAFYLRVPTDVLLSRLRERDRGQLQHEEKSLARIESIVRTYDEFGTELTGIDGVQSATDVTASILAHLCGSRS